MSLVQGNSSNKANVKWPGNSKLNNFEFSSDGVRVWRKYGKCEFREEKESVMDNEKVLYSKKLWVSDGRISATANVHCNQATSSGLHQNEDEGWTLKSIKRNKPFSDKQKKFLEEKFMVGETTGRKMDPVTVMCNV